MIKDFTVKIDYKNKYLEQVDEKEFGFDEYTQMIKLNLQRVIMDIEDLFYQTYGSKDEWSKDTVASFQKIRHKILDQANSVARLPQTLHCKGIPCNAMKVSEYLANIINNAKE